MKNKILSSYSGYSIIELLIASSFIIIILGGINQLFMNSIGTIARLVDAQKAKSEINLSFSNLKRDFFNAAVLMPEEDMLNPEDTLYRGVAGLRGHPKCRFAVDSLDVLREQYSVLRITTVARKIPPEELLKVWNLTDVENDMRISYRAGDEYLFQPADMGRTKEVLVIDIDGLYRTRFEVESATHKPESNIDPYTLLPVPGQTFPAWTQLRLKMPKPVGVMTLSPLNRNFISNSVIYPSQTRIFCVDQVENKIIQYDEGQDQVTTFFDGDNYGMDISRFEVRYFNTVKTERFDPERLFLFPANDMQKRRCINVYSMQIELKPRKVSDENRLIKIQSDGLMYTFHERRPANCEP